MYGVFGVGRGGWVMHVRLGWDEKGLVLLRKGGVIVVVNKYIAIVENKCHIATS